MSTGPIYRASPDARGAQASWLWSRPERVTRHSPWRMTPVARRPGRSAPSSQQKYSLSGSLALRMTFTSPPGTVPRVVWE